MRHNRRNLRLKLERIQRELEECMSAAEYLGRKGSENWWDFMPNRIREARLALFRVTEKLK